MKLYAVKTADGYLRRQEGAMPIVVALNKASVFGTIEEAQTVLNLYGSGQIAELTLTEKILSL